MASPTTASASARTSAKTVSGPLHGPLHGFLRHPASGDHFKVVSFHKHSIVTDPRLCRGMSPTSHWTVPNSSTRHLLHPQADRNVEEGFREDDRAAKQASIFRDSIQRHIRRPRLIHPSPPPSTGGLQRGRGTREDDGGRPRPDEHHASFRQKDASNKDVSHSVRLADLHSRSRRARDHRGQPLCPGKGRTHASFRQKDASCNDDDDNDNEGPAAAAASTKKRKTTVSEHLNRKINMPIRLRSRGAFL